MSRNHPFLDLDWSHLREQVNSRIELFDIRSPYVQNLMHSLRNFNLDLADLSPPHLLLTDRANSSRELVTQLRLLRSTLDIKLDQFERSEPRNLESGRSSGKEHHHGRASTTTRPDPAQRGVAGF